MILPSPRKKKRTVLTFGEKEKVAELIKKGCSAEKLALDYGISIRSVYNIVKAAPKIQKFRLENPESSNNKSLKTSAFPLLDEALTFWVYQKRAAKIELNFECVSLKAKEYAKQLYPEATEFKASFGYVSNLCERNNFNVKEKHGEQLNENQDPGWEVLDDQEIIEKIKNPETEQIEIKEFANEEGMSSIEPISTLSKMHEYIEAMKRFVEASDGEKQKELAMIYSLQNYFMEKEDTQKTVQN